MKNAGLLKDSLYSDLEFQISRIKRKKRTYVAGYRVIKVLVFVASATTTILVGWNAGGETGNKNAVLIISGLVSVFIAVEGLWGMKDKALSYDLLLHDLRILRDEMCFDFDKGAEVFTANRDSYFDRFRKIQEVQKAIIETAFD